MARVGISITKTMPFRNSSQDFSNVYYYTNGAGSLPDETGALSMIDDVVTAEKLLHATNATFKQGRLWSQVGSPSENNMIAQKNLSGTGSRNVEASLDRERAYLFRIRAGNDSRGLPVYLRKWYHCTGPFPGGPTVFPQQMANVAGFTNAERIAMANAMGGVKALAGAGGGWQLCAKSGRNTTETLFVAHEFLEHHQLGDMWRGG
jgi:hypothetical protein